MQVGAASFAPPPCLALPAPLPARILASHNPLAARQVTPTPATGYQLLETLLMDDLQEPGTFVVLQQFTAGYEYAIIAQVDGPLSIELPGALN